LTRLRVPTLVGYGTQDVIVPPANARLLLKRIPHAIGVRMPDAGDAFLFQQPTKTAAVFAHFLDQSRRHSYQDLVAGVVTERVVDLLEAVEVCEEHRQPGVLTPRASHGVG
jgi:hypothetical protein